MSIDEIIEAIDGLTVLELVELKDKLQEKYGVTAAAPIAVAAAGAAPDAGEEEQFSFTVMLESEGDSKIEVIKAVREVTSLGLKESKDLVEAAPDAVVAEDVSKEDAERIQKTLEDAGATVKLT